MFIPTAVPTRDSETVLRGLAGYSPRRGLNVPVLTIVDDGGRIIENDQRRLLRHIVQDGHGADMIFVHGTTGEWNRLHPAESCRLIAISADEVRAINGALIQEGRGPVECWVGLNGGTRRAVLEHLDQAIRSGADAAVIAPLAIADLAEEDIVRFFHRELTECQESAPRPLPVFLYDNADIHAPGHAPHIRTRVVKALSRLPWVRGIKVSAQRRVLGHYTKAALHYKQPGEFGIYIGNAPLLFEWYRPRPGILGRLLAGWHAYLLHDALPVGVVAGPANVLPREWQKAWRVCWAGDEQLRGRFAEVCGRFERLCEFDEHGRPARKLVACFKEALRLDGVIGGSLVQPGTPDLTPEQRAEFLDRYTAWREAEGIRLPVPWRTRRDGDTERLRR